ncbi:sodium-dependent transporter [Oceanobacillus halotolerans]|uniref:sodium-dependent transporter n=1 Tax=Oceanobacillus halotolerans TaxID=2663380 RepID=UPI0013DB414D|nr:sodium-dependent transporter [Oceanobacillus halotolerans]
MENENQWSSKLGFIFAAAGSAIGLGAIWKFPYVAGMNGGGAFLIIFIIFTLLIGLPLLISEFLIGRGSGKEAVSAYKKLAPNSTWNVIGKIGLVSSFLLLSFYTVVGGWVLTYTAMSIFGFVIQDGANYGDTFGYIIGSPWISLVGTAAFILINVIVLTLGIKNGIERAAKYLMPLLFIFFIILIIRALTLDGAMEGLWFFLKPDFTQLTADGLLYALGQSFFALSVGVSVMVTYSSYLGKRESLPTSAGIVTLMNVAVSILAGLFIFPVVFAFSMEPAQGPSLLFVVLPAVFSQMAFGELFLTLFLLLFLFATLTSSFSMIEILVAAFTSNKKRSRKKVTWTAGLIIFLAGIPAGLSSGVLDGITLFDKNIFDLTDYFVSNVMFPLGCLLIALFIGFKMDRPLMKKEFFMGNSLAGVWYSIWWALMRYVVPVTIVIVFLYTLGVFNLLFDI